MKYSYEMYWNQLFALPVAVVCFAIIILSAGVYGRWFAGSKHHKSD